MLCPSCGTENVEGKKFCKECGTALAAACGSCGAVLAGDEKFCDECGAPVGAGAPAGITPPTTREAPAAERRLVSVLFADLVGFTTLSESRDSEEVRELLSRYFDTCSRLIGLYGGTVEKFIGDAVMAVWGAPSATEDDAERAVRAALDLVAAVSALGDEVGAPQLRARAGVLTGEAAVTIGAEGQGMVAGDLVNTAARIQSAAEPGTVLVGEATRRTTEETVVYEDAGSHSLKGKESPVPLWKALRIVAGTRGSLKSHGLEAPFVGRDRELRRIKDLFHECAERGTPHLVSVTGIAGIGKSRLVWEFYKYFDGIAQFTYWHRGRCLSYGEGVTYWALADMVRMRCRIAEEDEQPVARDKLHVALEEYLPDAEERAYVEPRLAHLLGLSEQDSSDKQDLFAAWRLFFERLADVYPTVLAFEDMQWADASLLDFVEYLLEWSRNSPLYVITLARPELADRRPSWGAGHRNFTSLYLEPLSAAAMEELLGGLVPGLPDHLREQILARAEGVPLYAVETVRMLLDRGLIVEEGPVYQPVGEIGELEVPETLHALIAARLDGLSTEERRLLTDGAVLGKTFTRDGLAALSGLDADELEPLLASLVRKEVLGLQADARSPEHGQYGFLQDLVRHVAYETLSKHERHARHLAAAAHLRAVYQDEDEIAEVIAAHLVDAYEASPDSADADDVREQARDALVRAGRRARSLAASGEAQRYLAQAASLTGDPVERAELYDQAGWLAWYAADFDEAARLLGESVALYEAAGLTHRAARVSGRLALIERWQGHHDEAIGRMERALDVLAGDEPDEDIAQLATRLGGAYIFRGDFLRAIERLDWAIGVAEGLGSGEVLSGGFNMRMVIAGQQGRPQEAFAFGKQALEIGLEHNAENLGTIYVNLSDAEFQRDRYADALVYLNSALELARRRGSRPVGVGGAGGDDVPALPARPLGRGARRRRPDPRGPATRHDHAQPAELGPRDSHSSWSTRGGAPPPLAVPGDVVRRPGDGHVHLRRCSGPARRGPARGGGRHGPPVVRHAARARADGLRVHEPGWQAELRARGRGCTRSRPAGRGGRVVLAGRSAPAGVSTAASRGAGASVPRPSERRRRRVRCGDRGLHRARDALLGCGHPARARRAARRRGGGGVAARRSAGRVRAAAGDALARARLSSRPPAGSRSRLSPSVRRVGVDRDAGDLGSGRA